MKPAPFDYVRPSSIEEACALLAADEDARIIAGGQTLVPMLAMRLARPTRLIDIQRLRELAGVRKEANAIVVGATTRQAEVERNPMVARDLPLLAKIIPFIGHPPTRTRGTVGGSIAHADPAAELPLAAVTLGAEIVLRGPDGTTSIPADEFFIGPMVTAIPGGALVSEIRLPVWPQSRVGVGFHEINSRRSDFALVSAAAQVAFDEPGRCIACMVGVGGVGDRPIKLDGAAQALVGTQLTASDIEDAVGAATADLDAVSDLHASAEYRRRVAATLASRALADARDNASERRP